MSERNTFIRSLHDVGLAAWFGGSLMGAVGLHGGASAASTARDRIRVASVGWKKYSPIQWTAIVAHGIGGLGLIYTNKARLAAQPEGRVNTGVKAVIEIAAVAATLFAAIQGGRIGKRADEGAAEGVTEPAPGASDELKSAQRSERVAQWIVPALTGTLIVLAAQQGEQQRPVAGLLRFGKRS